MSGRSGHVFPRRGSSRSSQGGRELRKNRLHVQAASPPLEQDGGGQRTVARHNRGRRARGHAWSPVGHAAWHWDGSSHERGAPPLRILDTRVLPPALRPDQRGTGLSTSHAPAALTWGPPACPWGRRHQAATPRAAVRGSGRVSHGTARSPALCPQLTATSDHTPHSAPCYFHSTKENTVVGTAAGWAWPSSSPRS